MGFDTRLLASGVYRYGGIPTPGEFVTTFYKDGRTATVSVKRTDSGDVILSTNGKPDASVSPDWMAGDPKATGRRPLRDDVATQVLLPLLSLAHAPNARSAAVIGQGSGMTSHLLLASPTLRELATIEIEPEMIRASHAFRSVNNRVFTDPRARAKALGAWSAVAGAGGATGVLAGGVLTDLLSWRWILFIPALLAVVLLLMIPWRRDWMQALKS